MNPGEPGAPALQPEGELLPQRGPGGESQSGRLLVIVIVGAAFLALLILGVYVFTMNRSSRADYADSVRDLFRRRR